MIKDDKKIMVENSNNMILLYHNFSGPGIEDPNGNFSREWDDFKKDLSTISKTLTMLIESSRYKADILFSFDVI